MNFGRLGFKNRKTGNRYNTNICICHLFQVPSVLFAPSHLMAVFTMGISSALVLDSGYTETVVVPVYESIPLLKAWEALPLAGRAIHEYVSLFLNLILCI